MGRRRAKPVSSQRYRGEHPEASPRTATIKAFTERQLAETGLLPTVEAVAEALGMKRARVEHHYRILKLI